MLNCIMEALGADGCMLARLQNYARMNPKKHFIFIAIMGACIMKVGYACAIVPSFLRVKSSILCFASWRDADARFLAHLFVGIDCS